MDRETLDKSIYKLYTEIAAKKTKKIAIVMTAKIYAKTVLNEYLKRTGQNNEEKNKTTTKEENKSSITIA